MGDDQDKISRAAEILKKNRVGDIAGKLLNESFRYASTPSVSFDRHVKKEYLEDSTNGIVSKHQSHELIVATTKFRGSAAPDDDSYYADGLIYFDGVLVLKVGVSMEFDEYGSTIDFSVYPFSIKSMKAGEWLGMLTTCFEVLEADEKRRDEARKAGRDRQQASDIDLGDY
ncbi:MAG: hypothetical protein GDA67_01200 [Nitrospira sp. CR1.3]|nr:hypothetical protein [Nitrospira sp. CR1.3]